MTTSHRTSRRTSHGTASAAAVLVLGALALSACGSDAPSSVDPSCTPADEFETTESGRLTVGVPTYAPFSEIRDGAASGVDGDIITAIAATECLDVTAVPLEYSALIPAVQQGRIDVAVGSIYRTGARAEQAAVTDPIYLDQMAVVSPDGVTSVEEMQGRSVGTVDGNLWVDDLQAALGGSVRLYPSSTELQLDLEAGRLDVGIDSFGVASDLYADTDFQVEVITPDAGIAASEEPGQTGFYSSSDNTALATALNTQIGDLKSSGRIGEILEAWGLDASAADTGDGRLL